MAEEPMDDRASAAETTATAEPDRLVCPHCIEPVHELDHFCPHCNGPITSHAAIDPLGQVYAAGRAYQNATDRPSRLTVVAMWLIFGPQLPVLWGAAGIISAQLLHDSASWVSWVRPASPGSTVYGLFTIVLSLALSALYAGVLAKVTWRRWRTVEAGSTPV